MAKKVLNKILKLLPFATIILIFALLLRACSNPEEIPPIDQAPSAELYHWYSADEKVEHTETSSPIFGDGCYFTPGFVMVKYFSLKNHSDEARKYTLSLEFSQPNEDERKEPFITDVLKFELEWDTKFGDFEWEGPGHKLYFSNHEPYVTTNGIIHAKEVAAGEEEFFAIAIRMDSDAAADYMNKKMFIDVKVSDLSN